MTEVKSFEELKLKIQELIESYERQQSVRRSMRDDKGVRELGVKLKEIYWFRGLINSFEARVRKRMNECEEAVKLDVLKQVKVSGSIVQHDLAHLLLTILEGDKIDHCIVCPEKFLSFPDCDPNFPCPYRSEEGEGGERKG